MNTLGTNGSNSTFAIKKAKREKPTLAKAIMITMTGILAMCEFGSREDLVKFDLCWLIR